MSPEKNHMFSEEESGDDKNKVQTDARSALLALKMAEAPTSQGKQLKS